MSVALLPDGQTIRLSQQRYLPLGSKASTDDYSKPIVWIIPITIAIKTTYDDISIHSFVMEGKSATFKVDFGNCYFSSPSSLLAS